jgi:hypothetical protein
MCDKASGEELLSFKNEYIQYDQQTWRRCATSRTRPWVLRSWICVPFRPFPSWTTPKSTGYHDVPDYIRTELDPLCFLLVTGPLSHGRLKEGVKYCIMLFILNVPSMVSVTKIVLVCFSNHQTDRNVIYHELPLFSRILLFFLFGGYYSWNGLI